MKTQQADDIFYNRTGMDQSAVLHSIQDSLAGLDDGELYLQYGLSESFVYDDGRLKDASFNVDQGFGLRGIANELTAYAHATELSLDAIAQAGHVVRTIGHGINDHIWAGPPIRTNQMHYRPDNPLEAVSFTEKVKFLQDINAYARDKDSRVAQVAVSLHGSWNVIDILRPDGYRAVDIRPLVRINVQITAASGDRRENGFHGFGGRYDYSDFFLPENWKACVDEATRQAIVNLDSRPALAGEMTVVLGNGWPGILLHEAVGHGLEGDFNRKGSSAFSGRIGQRIATPGVTVVDDGTLDDRRGSLIIDDEGTPTERTVLIEDGILKGYMQDRLNGRLMKQCSTGNGRRENFACPPLPRMTNTFMLAGQDEPDSLIQSVKQGIYARNFGGGQVDITSGKFVFSCTEAYRIEDGKVTSPIKGATLIGDGPSVLQHVRGIGNDLELDPGVGTCGKAGQSVPAGVGQPSLLIDRLTVGGTEA